MSLGDFLGVVGIVLAFLLWWIGPKEVRVWFRNFHTGARRDALLRLENDGLEIESREALANDGFLRQRKEVYWPVVPASSPNLIHAAFIRFARPLSEAGLVLVVFVFDEYSALVQDRPPEQARQWAETFVSALREMGLSGCRHRVVYQSSVTKASRSAARVLPAMLRYLGTVNTADLQRFANGKTHVGPQSKVLRYVKPILNMVYLLSIGGRFGYTLSGADERTVWASYAQMAKSRGLAVPVMLLIPTMQSLDSSPTNVLDTSGNISHSDSLVTIRTKVAAGISSISKTTALGYALQDIHFPLRKVLTVAGKGPKPVVAASLDDVIDLLHTGKVDAEAVAAALATAISDVLSGKCYQEQQASTS